MLTEKRALRCPWCLRATREVHLNRSRKDGLYRCPDCCFMGTREDIQKQYEILSIRAVR